MLILEANSSFLYTSPRQWFGHFAMTTKISHVIQKAKVLLKPTSIKTTITDLYQQILPPPPVYECSTCTEQKTARDFPRRRQVPPCCSNHIHMEDDDRVCRACISKWLVTQLHTVHVTMLGCPKCASPWPSREILRFLSSSQRKTYRRFLRRHGTMEKYQPPDAETLTFMIKRDCRLCLGCGRAFEITHLNCGYMKCAHCRRQFYFSDAPTVREAHLSQ